MPVEGSILGVIGDVFSEANRRDPHPLYHRLRAEEPMAYAEEIDEWVREFGDLDDEYNL